MSSELFCIHADVLWLKHTLSNEDYYNNPGGGQRIYYGWPAIAKSGKDLREISVEVFADMCRLLSPGYEKRYSVGGVEYRRLTANGHSFNLPRSETLGEFFITLVL